MAVNTPQKQDALVLKELVSADDNVDFSLFDEICIEEEEVREIWERKLEFILTCVGYCVGLGNVWRFPYLVFNNGGGAFLIPYFLMLLLCGMPLFLMELALGQYFNLGPVSTWNATCPIGKGIGFAMMAVAFLCTIYYNVIIAWVLYYLYSSISSEVPWKHCNNKWNSVYCIERKWEVSCETNSSISDKRASVTTVANVTNLIPNVNLACSNLTKSPAEEFWERHVLQITSNFEESGGVRAELLVCLILAWVMIFVIISKGIKSSGKVVYFTATFPYIIMFVLLFRGALLEGAGDGIKYFLKPDFRKLVKAQVWVEAATQIFYSLGIGFGSLIAFGSYNKFHNNVVKDAITLSVINCFTSILAGFVVFSVLGNLSYNMKIPIKDVVTMGPGLVFAVYPEGLTNLPVSPLWSVLFFFMILTIGIDTQFAMMEAVVVGFIDEYKLLRKHKVLFTLALCTTACIIGISMVTKGGMYVLHLFNYQAGGVSLLFLAFFEIVAVSYGYGADRFERDLSMILGEMPCIWWKLCWKYFSPVIILIVFISSLVEWNGVTYNKYKYPPIAEFIGWILALASMAWIPILVMVKLIESDGNLFARLRRLCQPDENALSKVARVNSFHHAN